MKISIKNFVCIIMIIMLCIGLMACSVTDSSIEEPKGTHSMKETIDNIDGCDYSIVRNGEKNYIIFENIAQYMNNGQSQLATVEFNSIKEFKESVTKGTLEDWQKNIVATSFPKNEIGVMTCDFNNLYFPMLPTGASTSGVSWAGESYSFYLTIDSNVFGNLHCYTQEQYNNIYLSEYENYFDKETITVSRTEFSDDMQKNIIYYSTALAELMQVRYSLSSGSKTIIVDKTYRLNENFEGTSAVPYNVTLYCIEGENQYVIDLFGFIEDPSDSLLLSFGLTEYIESDGADKE